MALLTRLRRVEAGIEWLETEGMFRLCEIQFKWLELKKKVEVSLARDPGNEIMRQCGKDMGVELPPLPKPVVRPPPPPPPAPAPPPPAPAQPPPDERVREGSFADTTFATMVRRPPASWPPPPPPVEWETHDIPEHMQIRPVQWRQRGPQDVDDWDDGGPGYGQCLTEYDPLAEEDS
jgi:hypothetical protein